MMNMKGVLLFFLLLLVVLFSVSVSMCEGSSDLGYEGRRHDYKRSAKKPFLFGRSGEQGIPHFVSEGDAIASFDYVRLAPSVQSMKGSLWAEEPVPYDGWQAVITFSITGRGKLGGDGLAFWYTSNKLPQGKAMGSAEQFDGLMVFFDTYDNDNRRNNPYIGAFINDGTGLWDPETDGNDVFLGGCTSLFRNTAVPVVARITYYKGTLTVEADVNSKGANFIKCFSQDGIVLPKNYQIGLSAATGGLADDHDLIAFEFYELDPPKKQQGNSEKKHASTAPNHEQFEKIQEQVQFMRAKQDLPFQVDENYEAFMGKVANMDQLIGQLSSLAVTQSQMKDFLQEVHKSLQILIARVENGAPVQQSGHTGGGGNADAGQLTLMQQKLSEIQNEFRQKMNLIEKSRDGSGPAAGVANSVANMETTLRLINDRLSRLENQQQSTVQLLQAMDTENVRDARSTGRGSSKQRIQSDGDESESSLTLIVVILVLFFAVLAGAGVFYARRKSNPKKFI